MSIGGAMRKKLDTRFPAARIKKIMQTDDDVGKIALAVPVLVSKALELFLQDLLDKTYSITLQRGVKTVGSSHLKQCIHSFNVFDFLKDVVSKVPDVGGSEVGYDDRSAKRRKGAGEDNGNGDEAKKSRTEVAGHGSSSRGRVKVQGRGRGSLGARNVERDSAQYDKYEEDPSSHPHDDRLSHLKHETADDGFMASEPKENIAVNSSGKGSIFRNFDLNLDLDENGDASPATTTTTNPAATKETHHYDDAKYPGWSLADMEKMAMNPVQFALSYQRLDEEEDYDKE